MTCPRPHRWLLVEQVWKPQRRYAQALGSSLEHPKWAEFRVLGCSVLTWPCPFAQSWVITPSGSLPHGTESVTQWNQQGFIHPVSPGPGSQVNLCRWGFDTKVGTLANCKQGSGSLPGTVSTPQGLPSPLLAMGISLLESTWSRISLAMTSASSSKSASF